MVIFRMFSRKILSLHNNTFYSLAVFVTLSIAMLGTNYYSGRSAYEIDRISLVGINTDGSVEFRGTLVFFENGNLMTCVHNLVLFDCRGEQKSALEFCSGHAVIDKVRVNTQKDSTIKFMIKPLPSLSDGFVEIVLDITGATAAGTWSFIAGGEVTVSGTCLTWSGALLEEVRPFAKTANDLVEYWRTPRKPRWQGGKSSIVD